MCTDMAAIVAHRAPRRTTRVSTGRSPRDSRSARDDVLGHQSPTQRTQMEIAYWIVAGFLAVFYLYAGAQKVTKSQEQLAPMMGWVDTIPMWLVRTIGGLE